MSQPIHPAQVLLYLGTIAGVATFTQEQITTAGGPRIAVLEFFTPGGNLGASPIAARLPAGASSIVDFSDDASLSATAPAPAPVSAGGSGGQSPSHQTANISREAWQTYIDGGADESGCFHSPVQMPADINDGTLIVYPLWDNSFTISLLVRNGYAICFEFNYQR